MCLSLFPYFFFLFLFLSPKPFPFHSIGTREVVTQKNLSGLVPIRDLRLDPSLLCSIPLLALSPNLLIVWLFLSIAYLVAKLRCKWMTLWKISHKKTQVPEYVPPPGTYLDRGMCQSGSAQRDFMPYRLPFVVLNCKYLPNISPRGLVCSNSIVFSACNMFSQCPVTASCSWPGITCTWSLTFWCKAICYLYLSHALFPRERNSVWKEFVYLILFLECALTFPFLLKRNEDGRCFVTGSAVWASLMGPGLPAFISKRSPLSYSSKQFAESSHFLAHVYYFQCAMTEAVNTVADCTKWGT